MKLNLVSLGVIIGVFTLSGCGGSSSSDSEPTPQTPQEPESASVSFFVSDAPVDSATSVSVSFSSITLVPAEEGAEHIEIAVTDADGNPSVSTINLLDYQGTDAALLVDGEDVPVGEYSNLIINTADCPQNPNGATDACWVEDADGIKPLKTPSNKLRLGGLTIGTDAEQAYTLEFNLRASLVATSNGMAYNLKPHGIHIIDNSVSGELRGTVDVNLLNAAEACGTVYQEDTDHGKVVFLYEEASVGSNFLADEFDPDEAQNAIPDNATAPLASDTLEFDEETGTYKFNFGSLETGSYVVAFSCSAQNDDPTEYDAIVIPNPLEQQVTVDVTENETTEVAFTEGQ